MSLLSDGDYQGAAGSFAEAAAQFESASSTLNAPWARAAMLVPVVAQNRAAALDLATAAADASAAIADASGGHRRRSTHAAQRALRHRRDHAARRPARRRRSVDRLAVGHDRRRRFAVARSAVERAPRRPRRRSRRVSTAARERSAGDRAGARAVGRRRPSPLLRRVHHAGGDPGLGGFMGNWIEITADEGRIRCPARAAPET